MTLGNCLPSNPRSDSLKKIDKWAEEGGVLFHDDGGMVTHSGRSIFSRVAQKQVLWTKQKITCKFKT